MDARQEVSGNPFGMDEACENCRRCESRSSVIHGYGDVGADFLFVSEAPSAAADRRGEPALHDGRLGGILEAAGFLEGDPDADAALENAFLTHLVRCHGPGDPTDDEVAACDPFVTAEIRMINPHVIVPIGQRTLEALAVEYTTSPPEAFDVAEAHATTIRGRGFELVPMLEPDRQDAKRRDEWVRHLVEDVLGRDYRQTKGRQGR